MTTGRLFVGDQVGCRAHLAGQGQHYVYILRRPDGRPFYVGKGCGPRVFQHENEARHPNDRSSNAYKLNVIRSIWKAGGSVLYEIDHFGETPDAAFERETQLIAHFGRLHEGGPLTNLAAGGGSTARPAPSSLIKHAATLGGIPADDAERATLNRFVLGIADMKSVILKPVGRFTAKPTVPYPAKSMGFSLRQAAAVAATAVANSLSLDGPCRVPRRVEIEGVSGLVENGVACDLVTSGSATLVPARSPADECFDLSAGQSRAVVGLLGTRKCVDLGLLPST